MSWRPYIPFFDRANRLNYKKGSTASASTGAQYLYCIPGRANGYTCYTTVSDAVNQTGEGKIFSELPSGAVVVPTSRRQRR